ncbi:MAG: hypothetical protein VKJ02_02035, partial [Snowella sp.]|nr:hypothetical protein [Snowella sp.]
GRGFVQIWNLSNLAWDYTLTTSYANNSSGDFNKDGNTDILMSNASQGWSGFYTMNGTSATGWVGLPYSGGAVAM